jgi:hypothetical protein
MTLGWPPTPGPTIHAIDEQARPPVIVIVEELLRHDADAGSFLERLPQELEATVESDLCGVDSNEAWRDVLTPSEAFGCIGSSIALAVARLFAPWWQDFIEYCETATIHRHSPRRMSTFL